MISLILYSVVVLICIFDIFIFSGKIKTGGSFTVYTYMIFLPIILAGLPVVFWFSLTGDKWGRYLDPVPIGIVSLEIIALFIFIFIKANSFKVFLGISEISDKRTAGITYARKLIHYSIFASFFYFIPILGECIISILLILSMAASVIASLVIFPSFAFLLIIPFSVMNFIAVVVAIILSALILVFAINGIIRLYSVSMKSKVEAALYIILMFFPVINIICMFKLCSLAKKELNFNQPIPIKNLNS